MRSVGIKVLKNKLSEYVRLAQSGETILICDRDRVVAELSPPLAARDRSVPDALLAAMVREGLLEPALVVSDAAPPSAPLAPLNEILTELDEDRSDRT